MADRLRQTLNQALAGEDDLFLSGEGISAIPTVSLAKLKRDVEAAGFRIVPIVIVRPPFALLNSLVQQLIKGGRFDFAGRTAVQVSFADRLERIFSVFDDVQAYPFARVLNHTSGPCGFFLEEIMGISAEGQRMVRVNESISNEAGRIMGWVNADLGPLKLRSDINPLRKPGDFDALRHLPGSKFQMTREELGPYRTWIESENEKLAKLVGVEFCDEEIDWSKISSIEDPGFVRYGDTSMEYLDVHFHRLSAPVQESVMKFFRESPLSGDVERRIPDFQFHFAKEKAISLAGRRVGYGLLDRTAEILPFCNNGTSVNEAWRVVKQLGLRYPF